MRSLSAGGKRCLILCVDDDHSVLNFLETYLESNGYTVISTTNGTDALKEFASQAVAAVVLDYEMPGLNGAEVAFRMKQLKPQVPKLLFTGYRAVPPDAAPNIEGFCSKMEGPQTVLTWVRNLISPLDPAQTNTVSLHAHIAIARMAPEWESRRAEESPSLRMSS